MRVELCDGELGARLLQLASAGVVFAVDRIGSAYTSTDQARGRGLVQQTGQGLKVLRGVDCQAMFRGSQVKYILTFTRIVRAGKSGCHSGMTLSLFEMFSIERKLEAAGGKPDDFPLDRLTRATRSTVKLV